jgi:hypothetical protein
MKKVEKRNEFTIDAYPYSTKVSEQLTALLVERGTNTKGILWRSMCGYLAMCLNKNTPWEFMFVPKGAIARLKEVPQEQWGTWAVMHGMMGDGVKPVYNEAELVRDPHLKDALTAWMRGDYEEALKPTA